MLIYKTHNLSLFVFVLFLFFCFAEQQTLASSCTRMSFSPDAHTFQSINATCGNWNWNHWSKASSIKWRVSFGWGDRQCTPFQLDRNSNLQLWQACRLCWFLHTFWHITKFVTKYVHLLIHTTTTIHILVRQAKRTEYNLIEGNKPPGA